MDFGVPRCLPRLETAQESKLWALDHGLTHKFVSLISKKEDKDRQQPFHTTRLDAIYLIKIWEEVFSSLRK